MTRKKHFADHECMREHVLNGELPALFMDGQFVHVVAEALRRSRAFVHGELEVRGRESHQGVVIRKMTNGAYGIMHAPSADVLQGAQQVNRHFGGSFGGALEQITEVDAFVIAAPSWHRDRWITSPTESARYYQLAGHFNVPVVVDSLSSRTWIFTATGRHVEFAWRCQ